jgi:hypothetical protein
MTSPGMMSGNGMRGDGMMSYSFMWGAVGVWLQFGLQQAQ